ncbi:gliding motility lipoprotein GldB [Flavobacterium sp. AG291]|uniref:gliding motility lipoprotein GldB n=1 Tax=Flavobacterium sp. AG291 TaxID=2184000 RepID=UPI000E0B474A|nr:gliding motility lipoprotein GldB [Flavobacterium sp. AG291]RDI08216.1 protein involved in gliding motility GldB [Flavobacterium sp. AG291]
MKKYIFVLALMAVLAGCKKESEAEKKIAEIPVPAVKIERFDKEFFDAGPQGLVTLKQKFPYLFPEGNDDAVWINKMKDPFMLKLKAEADKKFSNLNQLEDEVGAFLQHAKYYYPQLPTPKVVTLISDDTDIKAVYTPEVILIPLSLYLGKDNYLYEGLNKYEIQQYTPEQIMPDIASSFMYGKVAPPRDRQLLSLMIYWGKELYAKDLLIPDTPEHDRIGYTKEQLAWAEANETEIWRYFVDKKLLYDSDPKLPARFINPAPFSKFYLELDNESPGRIGQWIGWQIVKAYAENNKNVPLQDLLAMDAKTIFDNSKYKPKK